LDDHSDAELLERTRQIANIIPVFGFYLQPAVGGRVLDFGFWKEFVTIPNVCAIKIAPFNRYLTLDVIRAVIESDRREEIALYTGNDDNIVGDLLTPFRYKVNGEFIEKRFVGGLLGQWAVWTSRAVELLKEIKFDTIYSSPLKRAYETAEIAGGTKEVVKDERLTEMDFGEWEGKTRDEFTAEDPELWARWSRDPETTKAGGTGETAGELLARVNSFFSELKQKHPSGNVLVVGHNGVNRFFLAGQLGMHLKHYRKIVQENSSITLIGFDAKEGFSLRKLNSKG
jgi:broad specificity phosphatase PhoE